MSTRKTGARTPCHCVNLRRAASAVSDFYTASLAPCGLTVSQFSLVSNLRMLETSSVTKLAEREGLERSTLVRTLKPLIEAGFVEDTSLPGSRDRVLRLTPAGVKAHEIGLPLWREAQGKIKHILGQDESMIFLRQLGELTAI